MASNIVNAVKSPVETYNSTKSITKIVGVIVTVVTAIMQDSTIQSTVFAFMTNHKGISVVFGAIVTIAALIHDPQKVS